MTVYYGTDEGVEGHSYDEQFGVAVRWDVPLLEGYESVFLKNHAPRQRLGTHFWGVLNAGLPGRLRRDRPDALLVHGWAYATYVLGIVAAKALGIDLWLRMESPLSQEQRKDGRLRSAKHLLLRRALLPLVDRCLYIGRQNRRFYEHFGVPERKLFPAPYCVDNRRWRRTWRELNPARDEIRREMGLDPEETVFLFVGKLMPKKRPGDVLRALKSVESNESMESTESVRSTPSIRSTYSNPDAERSTPHIPPSTSVRLLVVGDGELRGECESYAREHDLPVSFVGFKNQSELGRYYTAADVFVLPSGIGETWGLVVNEAMNFDLPVIVSDLVGCSDDLVEEGRNGFTYPVGDVEALADRMRFFLQPADRMEEMGQRSGEIIQNYCYDRVVEGILAAAGLTG